MTHAEPFFDITPVWRTAFWVSYLAWAGVEMWVFRRDRRVVEGENRDRGSRTLILALYWASLFGAFTLTYNVGAARLPLPPQGVMPVAIAVIWAGVALRLWAILTLGRLFRTSVTVHADHRLVEAGPYRRVRNPSYTGAMLTLVGCGLALGNGLALALVVVGPLIAYVIRIRVEEAALQGRFSTAFDAYKARSWALIPWVW